MNRRISFRYALRSILRSPFRTILSMTGAGVGCAIAIMAASWMSGGRDMQIRAATESGAGHLKIVPKGWVDTRENSLRLADWKKAIAAAESVDLVKTIVPRARASGVLAMGNRIVGVEVVGVVPEAEKASNRIVYRSTIAGRYLRTAEIGSVVSGREVARQLDVELDDDLQITVAGKGDIRSAMVTIVGLISTGSKDLDGTICHVTLEEMANLTGYPAAGEVALMLTDGEMVNEVLAVLMGKLEGGDEVVSWKIVNREIAANMDGDTAFTKILIAIIIIVVSLGITGARLTSVLERRREFGVLAALGMKGGQVVMLLFIEAVFIGLGGAVIAIVLGAPVAYWLSTSGVDLAAMMGGDIAMAGVLFDTVMYGMFGTWIIWYAIGISLFSTLVSSIYPAWFAVKVNPAEAIRVV